MSHPILASVKCIEDLAGIQIKLTDTFRNGKMEEWEALKAMGISLDKPQITPVPEDNDSRPTLEEVKDTLNSLGCSEYRIFDDVNCVGTCDYRTNRANFRISDDGTISSPYFG